MRKYRDFTGFRFNQLTVIGLEGRRNGPCNQAKKSMTYNEFIGYLNNLMAFRKDL